MTAYSSSSVPVVLAPLRGVTIRCFRRVFAEPIEAAGFNEAITPFVAANAGCDPLKDCELSASSPGECFGRGFKVTPQFIGKDPEALRSCLERIRQAGYDTADLNCGCPFPMVRNKFRGSGILQTPEVLEKMLAVGCEVMGEGRFSIKARLGVARNDELLALMPMINSYPLRFLTVHARNAKQMYDGECDAAAYGKVLAAAKVPVVYNGDAAIGDAAEHPGGIMVGRSFIRSLACREDIGELLAAYIDASREELSGERAVLGRMKELLAYWKDIGRWRRRWQTVKITRTLDELRAAALG